MPELNEVCVWEVPFPPASTSMDTTGSSNIVFTTGCWTEIPGDNRELKTIDVHPNPAGDYIMFDITNISSYARVELYNLQGKKVLEQRLSDSKRVQISRLSKGLYLYRLHDGGNTYGGKIAVE